MSSLTRLCLLAVVTLWAGRVVAQPAAVPDDALAWRSLTLPVSPMGPAVLVLVSARPGGAPVLWQVAEQRLQAVALPDVPPGWPAGTRAVLEEVGAFGHGLAPARVHWLPPSGIQPPANLTAAAWGYVDAGGRWVIAPQYGGASPFFGPAAMVMAPGPALIDRTGRRLPWEPSRDAMRSPNPRLDLTAFELRGWADSLLVTERNARRRVQDRSTMLADVVQAGRVQPLAGDYPIVDPSGQLWMLQNFEGLQAPRLWSPTRGVLPALEGMFLQRALAPDAVLVQTQDMRQDRFELRGSEGRLRVAGLSKAFEIDAGHIGACQEGSDYIVGTHAPARATGGLASYRCGVLSPTGAWLHPPSAQWMSHEGSWLRVQSPQGLCEFDLREPHGPCRPTAVPAPALVIGDDAPGVARELRYRGPGVSAPLAALRFDEASRFIGSVATATKDGVPGVIDRNGRWLTPRPPDDPMQRAGQALAAQLQLQPTVMAFGVVDARGRFVLPPLFQSLQGEADGQALTYCAQVPYAMGCQRIDLRGRPLPPRGPEPPSAKSGPVLPPLRFAATGPGPQPEGRNGRWGYRDAAGRWVIEPRFAAAEAFDGEVAIAAAETLVPDSGDDAEPQLRWGLIDRQGRWLAEPQSEEMERLSAGLVLVRSSNEWRVLGADGKPRSDDIYTEVRRLAPGLMVMKRGDGKPCLLNPRGECPVVPGVSGLRPLDDKRVVAEGVANGENALGILDIEGRWLIPPRFKQLQPFGPSQLLVQVRMPLPGVSLPAVPAQGVVTRVQALHDAGLVVVDLATPAGPRAAVLRADGRWLTESSR